MRILVAVLAGYLVGLTYTVVRDHLIARRHRRMMDTRSWTEFVAAMRRMEDENLA